MGTTKGNPTDGLIGMFGLMGAQGTGRRKRRRAGIRKQVEPSRTCNKALLIGTKALRLKPEQLTQRSQSGFLPFQE